MPRVYLATLASNLWCRHHEAGSRDFTTCPVSLRRRRVRSPLVYKFPQLPCAWLPEAGCALDPNTPKSFELCGLLEPWRPSMAKFDYGLWVGNLIAVVLVALALTYFISLLRSVMDMDLKDLKLTQ